MGVSRVDRLTDEQQARFDEWADKWVEVGLRTGPADRAKFESSVRECYRFAGIPFPGVVVWVPSPLVLAFAAPAAALAIGERLKDGVVDNVVAGAVAGVVAGAVADAVDNAVAGVVDDTVAGAVADTVADTVAGAVDNVVADAVADTVAGAVADTVADTVADAGGWRFILGGQFWVGGWYWGGAQTSFFREVCNLELPGDVWDRARAYEGTMESACWWWPHRRFVMVSERPVAIHRELVNPDVGRGLGSHRLHNSNGPAVVWPDGWGVWAIHGVRVPQDVVETPHLLTADRILGEPNAEVRRVMIERYGFEKLLDDAAAVLVDADVDQHQRPRELWRVELAGDEPLVMVRVTNSTAETDGSYRSYTLRVPPDTVCCRQAVAWTFDVPADDYLPAVET